jgi:hypothetical protein
MAVTALHQKGLDAGGLRATGGFHEVDCVDACTDLGAWGGDEAGVKGFRGVGGVARIVPRSENPMTGQSRRQHFQGFLPVVTERELLCCGGSSVFGLAVRL